MDVQGTLDSWNSERKNEVYQKNHFSIFEKSRYYSTELPYYQETINTTTKHNRENVPNQSSLHAQPKPSTPTGSATNAPISGTHHSLCSLSFHGSLSARNVSRARKITYVKVNDIMCYVRAAPGGNQVRHPRFSIARIETHFVVDIDI